MKTFKTILATAITSILLTLLVACIVLYPFKRSHKYVPDAVLRAKIDSAWKATSFKTNPELCSDMDAYYTILENMDNGYYEQNVKELDSISVILKQQLK